MKGYELKRMPTHPGEILREDFILPHNLTQVELAKALKTTFRTINEIVNCKRSISPEMALKLARYFGTSPDIWLNLQADYDLYKAKLKSRKIIEGIKPHEKRQIAA
jgi:addiction module HigA family antidote